MEYSIKKWDKHLIGYLWIIVTVSTLFTLSNINHADIPREVFFKERLLPPFATQVLVMSILHYTVKKEFQSTPYLLTLGSYFIVTVLVIVHHPVSEYLLPLYSLPIYLSLFFLKKRVTLFAFIVSVVSFKLMKVLYQPFMDMNYVETTTTIGVIIISFFLANALTNRFLIIYDDLIVSVGKEKDLLYKNTLYGALNKIGFGNRLI